MVGEGSNSFSHLEDNMADGYKLWQVCTQCKGVGTIGQWIDTATEGTYQQVTCPVCNGVKYIALGWCSVDTFTLPSNLPNMP
jgi:DnaJ-class molecular chaperone